MPRNRSVVSSRGFCWIRPELRERLEYNQAYWLAMQTADELGGDRELPESGHLGARRYDVFGTANFFNFTAWTASLEYILEQGPGRIAAHDLILVDRFCGGLDRNRFDLVSPGRGTARSTLILVSHRDPERNAGIHQGLKEKGIDTAFRRGRLRFSPHLYNTPVDIDRAIATLSKLG
jgi:selenocysteine lyase/cysteine desulfurase